MVPRSQAVKAADFDSATAGSSPAVEAMGALPPPTIPVRAVHLRTSFLLLGAVLDMPPLLKSQGSTHLVPYTFFTSFPFKSRGLRAPTSYLHFLYVYY